MALIIIPLALFGALAVIGFLADTDGYFAMAMLFFLGATGFALTLGGYIIYLVIRVLKKHGD